MNRRNVFLMTEAVALDRVSLWVPADSDMFVPIGGHDVLPVGSYQKRSQKGSVTQNEFPARGIFMR